jgi:ABC-type antimicrobial peptide transport system permease subunit
MIEKLASMRLLGMVEALKTQEQDPSACELQLLASVYFMIRPFDAVAYLLGIAVVSSAAAVAAFIPSRRASRIDPVETLRAD